MLKYTIGFIAGITLSLTIAAGPQDDCYGWQADAVLYEHALLIACEGDVQKMKNIKTNFGIAAATVLGRKGQQYTYEIDRKGNRDNANLLRFGRDIMNELQRMFAEDNPRPTLDA